MSITLVMDRFLSYSALGFAGGMPALQGVDGRTFAALVSGMEPGRITEHVRGTA